MFLAKEDKELRKEYRFILVVNNNIIGTCPLGGWYDVQNCKDTAAGIVWGAKCFKKTAGVLVYVHGSSDGQELWALCHSCEIDYTKIQGLQPTYQEAALPELLNQKAA